MGTTENTDLSIFDRKIFYYFNNNYKIKIDEFLRNKHLNEKRIKFSLNKKKSSLVIWNALLIKEISSSIDDSSHFIKCYDDTFNKIQSCRYVLDLNKIEINMFSEYMDLKIKQQYSINHNLVDKMLYYLHSNIESTISLESTSKYLGISKSYTSSLFKKHMNESLVKYNKNLKLERAKDLLKISDESIINISAILCFKNLNCFNRAFSNYYGITPIKYKSKL